MKDKEKQIEEMYQEFLQYKHDTMCTVSSYRGVCENFINLGYRKLPEDSIALSINDWINFNKEHANELIKTREEEYDLGYKQGSKETAEKIFNQIIWFAIKRIGQTTNDSYYQISFKRLQELAKQHNIEIKE